MQKTEKKRGEERVRRGKNPVSTAKFALIALIIVLTIALSAVSCMMQSKAIPVEAPAPTQTVEINDRFAEGVVINGISVAGLDRAGAQKLLANGKTKLPANITLAVGEKNVSLSTSAILETRNTEQILDQALAAEEGTNKSFDTQSTFDVAPLQELIAQAALDLASEPINASANYNENNPEKFDYVEGEEGIGLDAKVLLDEVQAYITAGDFSAPLQPTTVATPPAVTSEMVKQNTTLFASAFTSFAKSPYYAKNRVHNINMAADIINGTVLAPGEEFSFNDVVGPRTAAGGWKAAGAINDGKSVEEIGGGICQVSSTLFNTVLKADIEVTKRSPHSWPLSYVTTGQDATVSTGGPDFKFRNNRETPIIIVTNVDEVEKKITIDFYGEPLKDNMRIELESQKTSTIGKPKTEVTLNSSMAPGTSKTMRDGRGGSKHETYKLYYKGDELVERVFSHNTSYRAIAGKVEVGPELAVTKPDTSGSIADVDIPDETTDDFDIPDEVVILE